MKITEHRTESQFLVQAEKCHKQAELAWIERRTMDMIRFSDDARELMERYYAALDAFEPEQESPVKTIEILHITDRLTTFDRILIGILAFISSWGLIQFLMSFVRFSSK